MSEEELNIQYICNKTLLDIDDELVPIILELIKDSYKSGLCQSEFDNTMDLIEENQELKRKLNESIHKATEFESEVYELKKQLEERPKEYVFIGNAQNKTRDFINQITKDNKEFKNQQKEFIEYMNKTIEELECDDVDDEEIKGYLIQRIDTFKEILNKYKEMIGENNEIRFKI